VLLSNVGAVWMINSMRIIQYDNLRPADEIVYKTFPRWIDKNRYIIYVEIYRGDELVIRFDTGYIPVHFQERKLVPIEKIEPLFKCPPGEALCARLERLHPDCDFTDCGSDTVRLSDCDSNGHMTSATYPAMACDVLGFFNGDRERIMKMMQVDFHSEVKPGTELSFRAGEKDGLKYMQGLKPDGTVAFTAACAV